MSTNPVSSSQPFRILSSRTAVPMPLRPIAIGIGGAAIVAVGMFCGAQAVAQQSAPSPSAQPQSEPRSSAQQPGAAPRTGVAQHSSATQRTGADLPASTIRMLQHSLMQGGYPIDAADGVWGPQTATALWEFQQVKGLQATGQPDPETLAALGITANGFTQSATQRAPGPVGQPPPQVQKRTPADLDRATIRAIQQALDRQGLQVGPVDGVWGERTASAIGNLQRARGLAASGEPDAHTLAALGLLPGGVTAIDTARSGKQPQPSDLDPAAIRMIQQSLNQRGLDVGPIDGIWGERTENALREFQRMQGLEPLGEPDVHSLAALGMLPGSDTVPAAGTVRSR